MRRDQIGKAFEEGITGVKVQTIDETGKDLTGAVSWQDGIGKELTGASL